MRVTQFRPVKSIVCLIVSPRRFSDSPVVCGNVVGCVCFSLLGAGVICQALGEIYSVFAGGYVMFYSSSLHHEPDLLAVVPH